MRTKSCLEKASVRMRRPERWVLAVVLVLSLPVALAAQQAGQPDPFLLPVTAIQNISREVAGDGALVRVQGSIIDQQIGVYCVVKDETGSIRVEPGLRAVAKPGVVYDVVGRPTWDGMRVLLRDARYREVIQQSGTGSAGTQARPAELPTLTKAWQVRDLTPERAAWRYPVRLKGVVTYYDPGQRLVVNDDISGIFVFPPEPPPALREGDEVEVIGVSDPGTYSPVVRASEIKVLGRAALPEPRKSTIYQLIAAEEGSQWVEISGVVQSAVHGTNGTTLTVADMSGRMRCFIRTREPMTNLVDAVVQLRGVTAARGGENRRLVELRLLVPAPEFVQIVEPSPGDPLNLTVQPIVTVHQFRSQKALQRRVCVSGVVTVCRSNAWFVIQDATGGVQVFASDTRGLEPGTRVKVAGYPVTASGTIGRVLREPVWRIEGSGPLPDPIVVPAESTNLLAANLHCRLVRIHATLVGQVTRGRTPELQLQVGSTPVVASFGQAIRLPKLRPGSLLEVAGVYMVLADDERNPVSVALHVPGSEYIRELERGPWLTTRRIFTILAVVAIGACVSALWGVTLQHRVNRRTRELAETRQMLQTILNTIPQRVFWKDINGRFLGCNLAFAKDAGLSSPEEIIGKTDHDLNWRTMADKYLSDDRKVIETGQPKLEFEEEQLRPDGTMAWLLTSKVPLRDQDGRIIGVLGTYSDITEHKRAEQAMEEMGNLLQTMLDNMPDPIYFKDRQSRFVYYSKAFTKHFNVKDPADLKGKSDFDFFTEEHARRAFEDEQQIIQTGQPIIGKLEKETHKDGRVTWCLSTKMPWRDRDGNIIGTFGMSRDVTELVMLQQRLAYEEQLLKSLLDNVPDSIYFKDRECRFVRVSRSKEIKEFNRNPKVRALAAQKTNTPPDQEPPFVPGILIGLTDFDLLEEKDARLTYEDEQRIMATGQPIIGKVERQEHPDGSVTWSLTTKVPWRDADGNIIGIMGVSKDITSLKEAEQELEKVHKQLVEASRWAGMAEVATDVLHNVGNVLTSVNISCALVIERIQQMDFSNLAKIPELIAQNKGRLEQFFNDDPRGKRVPEYIAAVAKTFAEQKEYVQKELGRLRQYVDHIKEIVAMQQNYAKVAGVIEKIDIAQLVDDALRVNDAALQRHDVRVVREIESGLPEVLVDKHKVLQILVNLIRNAKYALSESGKPDRLLTIRVQRVEGDNVQIQVIDNGIGIPPENLTKIFSHGFTTKKDGHGFGLHSSALAARDMGGTLVAASEGPGKGATFTLTIPIQPPKRS